MLRAETSIVFGEGQLFETGANLPALFATKSGALLPLKVKRKARAVHHFEGDPDDVLAYAMKNKSFPHDTTADQWFDEAHFENYHELGMTTGAAPSEQIAAAVERCLK